MGNFCKKIGFISLGCDKNRVDTEKIITVLSKHPEFTFVSDQKQAEIIIINTCAFIEKAREEGRNVIKKISKLKKTGHLERLIVVGCYPVLEGKNFIKLFPEVDKVIFPSDYGRVDDIIFEMFGVESRKREILNITRRLTTPLHYAYLKIAEGCNNHCSYCLIPKIRGNYKSFKIEDLVREANMLVEKGVRELILVAQDTTYFGKDTNGKEKLSMLLHKLSKIKKLVWIRLLYCYPSEVDDDLISEIKDNPKVLRYIDIPLQHVSNHILRSMNRKYTKKDIIDLIEKLRSSMPDIKIRTTFMVGFPGETARDIKELCKFLIEYRLDNVGFFKYSREKGTPSYDYPKQVSEKEKDKRLKLVQSVQEKVAEKNGKSLIKKYFKVIVDSYDRDHKFYIGRSYFMAPSIDFEILFSSIPILRPGSFVDVEITDFSKGYFIGKVEKRTTY